jgi:hypothetical protein
MLSPAKEAQMATRWILAQADLFQPTPPVDQLAETKRQEALNLLQALISEALNQAQERAAKGQAEVCDDQDLA